MLLEEMVVNKEIGETKLEKYLKVIKASRFLSFGLIRAFEHFLGLVFHSRLIILRCALSFYNRLTLDNRRLVCIFI